VQIWYRWRLLWERCLHVCASVHIAEMRVPSCSTDVSLIRGLLSRYEKLPAIDRWDLSLQGLQHGMGPTKLGCRALHSTNKQPLPHNSLGKGLPSREWATAIYASGNYLFTGYHASPSYQSRMHRTQRHQQFYSQHRFTLPNEPNSGGRGPWPRR
jgi:hypothetical protein